MRSRTTKAKLPLSVFILLHLKMELTLNPFSLAPYYKVTRNCKPGVHNANYWNMQEQRRKKSIVSSALPETAASVVLAAVVVGAAATTLNKRIKASQATDTDKPVTVCEDCSGSGICAECNGEGYVLKRLSKEKAEKARTMAKDAATRYTAGLPKKWSYCTKCSSARSCRTCGGSGKLSV